MPAGIKVFLLTLAILDDLGAIVIIAMFYDGNLAPISLGIAAVALLALFALNRSGVARLAPYFFVGLVLWVSVLKSGVHATLAGVALALFIPLRVRGSGSHSPLRRLEPVPLGLTDATVPFEWRCPNKVRARCAHGRADFDLSRRDRIYTTTAQT